MKDENIGRCFELSLEYQAKNPEYILVHGIITNLFPPYQSIYHAWCEKDGMIYDAVMENEYPEIVYNALFKAKAVHKYNIDSAILKTLINKTYGFWDEMPEINEYKYYDQNGKLKPEFREMMGCV